MKNVVCFTWWNGPWLESQGWGPLDAVAATTPWPAELGGSPGKDRNWQYHQKCEIWEVMGVLSLGRCGESERGVSEAKRSGWIATSIMRLAASLYFSRESHGALPVELQEEMLASVFQSPKPKTFWHWRCQSKEKRGRDAPVQPGLCLRTHGFWGMRFKGLSKAEEHEESWRLIPSAFGSLPGFINMLCTNNPVGSCGIVKSKQVVRQKQ